MKILDLNKSFELLEEVNVSESREAINQKQIGEIKKIIDLKPPEEFGTGNCLPNAYSVAQITGAEIVEGIAYVKVRSGDILNETIIKHAWNIIDGQHFDVTKDYVWPNLNALLENIDYEMRESFSYNDYIPEGNKVGFKSNSDQIAVSLRYQFTKKNVLNSLNSLGLEFEHQENLLKECQTGLKKSKLDIP